MNKIEQYYKDGDFDIILRENETTNPKDVKSKKTLYIIALAYDQSALKKDKKQN